MCVHCVFTCTALELITLAGEGACASLCWESLCSLWLVPLPDSMHHLLPPPPMFQTIKHIENFKVSGKIYCNHYNSGLSLEATRQARRAIYTSGSEAWEPLHHPVHSPRKGPSSLEQLLFEVGGQWGSASGLLAHSLRERWSRWHHGSLKPPDFAFFFFFWLCPLTS